jgi:exopolysaccharide production protein ExoQ
MTLIGTILVLGIVCGLFYLVRDNQASTSRALWIPTLWFWIVFSRPVTMWLHFDRNVTLQNQYVEGSPVDATFYGLLILASLVVVNLRGRAFRNFLQLNFAILLYFFYCAVSVAWSDAPGIALKRWIKAAGEMIVILVVLTDPSPTAALKRLFTRLSFVLIPLSALFIYVIPSLGSSYDPIDRKIFYFGVCTWKNQLGLLCMICGLSSLWQMIDAYCNREMKHRVGCLCAHAMMFVLSAWLIVKADAMTSFSCLGLASAVMILSAQRWATRRPGSVFLLVASATGIALFALFIDTAGSLLHSIGRNSTLTGRTEIWSAVLAQHTNPILGTGFESFWMGNRMQSVWDMSQVGIEEAHNGYLEFYVNLGLIGLALLGILIVDGYRNVAESFRRDPQAGRLRVALFTGAVIYNFTEAGFRMMTPMWVGFLLVITAAPAQRIMDAKAGINLHWRLGASRKQVRILQ